MKNKKSFFRFFTIKYYKNRILSYLTFLVKEIIYKNKYDNNNSPKLNTPVQPYIIRIENHTSEIIDSKIDLLGASDSLFEPNFGLNSNLIVKSSTPNVSYRKILFSTAIHPSVVSMMYIKSASLSNDANNIQDNTKKQILEKIIITHSDAYGNVSIRPVSPVASPQEEYNISFVEYPFILDGFTKMSISKIYPNTVFIISLYKSDEIDIKEPLYKVCKNGKLTGITSYTK